MREIFSVFNPPGWANWFFDHPYLTTFGTICLGLFWINLKAEMTEKRFKLSKNQANFIVIGTVLLLIYIILK